MRRPTDEMNSTHLKFPIQTAITGPLHEWMGLSPARDEFVRWAMHEALTYQNWGDLDPEDIALNDEAAQSLDGGRILCAYRIPPFIKYRALDDKIWVIIERSRDIATALYPSEY